MIWVDVSDLVTYGEAFRRPSGVQRVVFELCRALAEREEGADDVGFVRHDAGCYRTVAWASIAEAFARLNDETPRSETALQMQVRAARALMWVAASFLPNGRRTDAADMKKGDALLIVGAGWSDPDHVAQVSAARRQHGVTVATLIYDIIPAVRPEWFDTAQSGRFCRWLDGILAISDRVLAISQATADDVATYRARLGLAAMAIGVVRLGDGFVAEARPVSIREPFALFVSTIEIRKNHALLVEVWRRLLMRMEASAVPLLVFAGRRGGLTGDLLRELEGSRFLDGHVVLVEDASDADMAGLYRACRFSLFPSLYEGWGLPVAEGLSFGRPCFASSASSVPEVGGDLVRYFDPLDPAACARLVGDALGDAAGLEGWAARIRAEYRPTPWSKTAAMVLEGIA